MVAHSCIILQTYNANKKLKQTQLVLEREATKKSTPANYIALQTQCQILTEHRFAFQRNRYDSTKNQIDFMVSNELSDKLIELINLIDP